jgi:RluA family pseudouridine synthase
VILDADHQAVAATQLVRAGQRYVHRVPAVIEPAINARIEILYEDEALIVLNKPAPLPMHAGGRFLRNTLQYILNEVYAPQKPRPAHRLDANTTGVVVMTRTRSFAALVQDQFTQSTTQKLYLVRVAGLPQTDVFRCDAPIGDQPGKLGSRSVDTESGLPASTEFRVLQRDTDGTALLEARPLTGRTNQIRVHLWHLGLPVSGDLAYLANRQVGDVQTLGVDSPPLCLHAWQLTFIHPVSAQSMTFTASPPAWAR